MGKSWRLMTKEELTDDDWEELRKLCREEKAERAMAYWDSYPGDTEESDGECDDSDV